MFRVEISKPGSYPDMMDGFDTLAKARNFMEWQANKLASAMTAAAKTQAARDRSFSKAEAYTVKQFDSDHAAVQLRGLLNWYLLTVSEY